MEFSHSEITDSVDTEMARRRSQYPGCRHPTSDPDIKFNDPGCDTGTEMQGDIDQVLSSLPRCTWRPVGLRVMRRRPVLCSTASPTCGSGLLTTGARPRAGVGLGACRPTIPSWPPRFRSCWTKRRRWSRSGGAEWGCKVECRGFYTSFLPPCRASGGLH